MKSNFGAISNKGQITIPVYIRNKLRLTSGSKVEYVLNDNCVIIIPITNSATNLKGMLPKPKNSHTIEEMNDAVKNARGMKYRLSK